jgi:protein-disulfide isomerase
MTAAPNKEWLANAALVVMMACAIVTTVRVTTQTRRSADPPVEPPRSIGNWREMASLGIRIGDSATPIVITEFTDYQCPSCQLAAVKLRELVSMHPGKLSLSIRHMPLESIHPFALQAAMASSCAAKEDRFEAYHDSLFAHQREIPKTDWTALAGRVGISDTGAFTTCLRNQNTIARVRKDQRDAAELGFIGTPSFLVNDLAYPTGTPWSRIAADLDRKLTDITK